LGINAPSARKSISRLDYLTPEMGNVCVHRCLERNTILPSETRKRSQRKRLDRPVMAIAMSRDEAEYNPFAAEVTARNVLSKSKKQDGATFLYFAGVIA
jgi:hypothetical protein